jgi:hypothetical protein
MVEQKLRKRVRSCVRAIRHGASSLNFRAFSRALSLSAACHGHSPVFSYSENYRKKVVCKCLT